MEENFEERGFSYQSDEAGLVVDEPNQEVENDFDHSAVSHTPM
jgi:hypothetical protein